MSSSSQGRALPFPLAWTGSRSRNGAAVEELELSDEETIARLQAGDSGVLYVLFERYSRLVMDVALHILHDRGEAEEIVQDVFFFVYRKAKIFDPTKGMAKPWIVQTAYHRSLDRRTYLDRGQTVDLASLAFAPSTTTAAWHLGGGCSHHPGDVHEIWQSTTSPGEFMDWLNLGNITFVSWPRTQNKVERMRAPRSVQYSLFRRCG